MCILCVLQRASLRARNMLPWLVLALVALWAVSQLLPSPFRLEMTSSRLACVLFLAGYFSWYEFLLPHLSQWRARRSARCREQRWSQAVELQKLRKAATRRCRNCLNPYKDQNPAGGGRFMCSYCGHISKRPILDIPGPPGAPGIIGDILGRNAWICTQDWQPPEGGNWRYGVSHPASAEDHCLTERSYSDAAAFTCKFFSAFLCFVRWFGGRFLSSSGEYGSTDADGRGLLSGKGDGGGNFLETKSDKARRKAEEKRRARLEKELLEEEERKQREEVARLMEEQRKLRDEKSDTKKEQSRGSDRSRDNKKDLEKRRQERKKDRDKGSSKSNSDVEDVEKKSGFEFDKKHDSLVDKKNDNNEKRDPHKACLETNKPHANETGTQGAKSVISKSRYLDRVKGSFLSTSTGFSGANFFGKASQNTPTNAAKPNKAVSGFPEQANYLNRKEIPSVAQISAKQPHNADDGLTTMASLQPSVITNPPETNAWKKPLHNLFSGPSAIDASSSVSDMNHATTPLHVQKSSPGHAIGSQMSFPCNAHSQMMDTVPNTSNFPVAKSLPTFGGASIQSTISEETELFEDPCYVPDPIVMIEPMPESLDNFRLSVGSGFAANTGACPIMFRKPSMSTDMGKPSPIESPLSRARLTEHKDGPSGKFPCTKGLDSHVSSHGSSSATAPEPAGWQIWDTPLTHESLSFGASANRALYARKNKPEQEIAKLSPVHKHAMQCPQELNVTPFSVLSLLNTFVGSPRSDDSHAILESETDPWLENSVLQPLFSDSENQLSPFKLPEDISLTNADSYSPHVLGDDHDINRLPSNCWSKNEWPLYGDVPASKALVGGLYTTDPRVQQVWTFK